MCYADEAVIITDIEDNFQRQLYTFYYTAEKLNMIISIKKTKLMVISKVPRIFILEI